MRGRRLNCVSACVLKGKGVKLCARACVLRREGVCARVRGRRLSCVCSCAEKGRRLSSCGDCDLILPSPCPVARSCIDVPVQCAQKVSGIVR